jgi:DNA-binding transcriptional LysR family regulator
MLFEQLKAFYAVVNNSGFQRASESIHLSQPAVSIRIRELEKHLGIELFRRSGRQVRLTEAGKLVADYTVRLMIIMNDMNRAIDEIKGFKRGQLRCGATTTIAVHRLPRVLLQFKKLFPNVEIKVVVEKTAEIEKRIMADLLDVGLVSGTMNDPSGVSIRTFLTDEFVLITPPKHLLAGHPKISLKQVAKLPLILREHGSSPRRVIEDGFRSAGIAYQCMMEIETSEAVKKAVAEGIGCSIAPLCSIQLETQTGALSYTRISGAPMKRQFRAITHKDRKVLGPVEPFLELLGATAAP